MKTFQSTKSCVHKHTGQAVIKLVILLPLPPDCWDYMHEPLYLALKYVSKSRILQHQVRTFQNMCNKGSLSTFLPITIYAQLKVECQQKLVTFLKDYCMSLKVYFYFPFTEWVKIKNNKKYYFTFIWKVYQK
jgi:hypothetical protein